ncbi:hypothetical protein CSB37_03770 [bacterium DOLZORAL124_38_8]|nr:MAG: hypothetical protein CSB37_03770 [bacterium DOLZORAL124_38_8]
MKSTASTFLGLLEERQRLEIEALDKTVNTEYEELMNNDAKRELIEVFAVIEKLFDLIFKKLEIKEEYNEKIRNLLDKFEPLFTQSNVSISRLRHSEVASSCCVEWMNRLKKSGIKEIIIDEKLFKKEGLNCVQSNEIQDLKKEIIKYFSKNRKYILDDVQINNSFMIAGKKLGIIVEMSYLSKVIKSLKNLWIT